ncbi:PREDICTED: E3 ubiquitin-protein ligase RGLG1-like isoform X2 [Nelumbo nucifera]|uniref:E3 ubiquitin-protein ligase RGLG1-like isoform X2 n=2 Tax=Nelumbo nucifera TaxID=4432 RepID=A0A1U8Q0V2_NELNU|nr:PREDICTED: E3 ubiquitin-protein ligase RGLG1-like isoform X2 [Nelumbo nucifera]DAD44895.1 TPA_asm: hypothetical protein HUJ06_003125 [Nelumbo nucifera]
MNRVLKVFSSMFSKLKRLLRRSNSRITNCYDSLEEVPEVLEFLGLESNLIVGIDFTKSNEWEGVNSFSQRSLHHIGITQNPYQQALTIIGRTITPFDKEVLIPCFGFGDVTTLDESVFSFNPENEPCFGFDEMLARYNEIVPQLRLAEPTSFAPIIEMAVGIVERSGGDHHVLLIISDGQVDRRSNVGSGRLSPHDKTVEAIVQASAYPLSIVAVGVGDGPWDVMREFANDIPDKATGNFQFVNFTEIISRNIPNYRKEIEFAQAALKGIVLHHEKLTMLEILGFPRGGAPATDPLPTPLHHHYFEGSNLQPTAPSVQPETSNSFQSFDHSTCGECGRRINNCPICRSPIGSRLRLY